MANSVLYETGNGIGWITLNRPKAINSLSLEVVSSLEDQLAKWKEDPEIALVCLIGAGDKGFCAGGDVRELYEHGKAGDLDTAFDYFTTEYRVDQMIHEFPKPILAYTDKVVMGGGVGISIGASHRIVTEKTKWAMPEMNIGFFPDVGSSYFLNQMPGSLGLYLALTSTIMKAGDVLNAGAADYFIGRENWPRLRQALQEKQWNRETAHNQLSEILDNFCASSKPASEVAGLQQKIDQHFTGGSIEGILSSLQQAAEKGDEWAAATKKEMLKKSPTSLKVTLKQLQKGKKQSLEACLAMEHTMAMNFMRSRDFYEGVRAVLVDKDHNPQWCPSTIEEVSDYDVITFFKKTDAHE